MCDKPGLTTVIIGLAVKPSTVPVKNQQHIPLFSEDPKLFFSEKER